MKLKRRQTKMVFLEEDWPSSPIEFVEQHDASQYNEINDELQSESSRVIKNSEFVFEDTLYGELPERGGKIRWAHFADEVWHVFLTLFSDLYRDASTQTSLQYIKIRISINGESEYTFHAAPTLK